LSPFESRSDDRDEQRRGENAGDDEDRRDQREQGSDRSSDPVGLCTFAACDSAA
jgi:hypothetical protein